jgi:predicted ATPase/DNA-binding CsgD family transcriptional regulator
MANPQVARFNNLPIQLTSFIGREREISEVKHLLLGTRLVTLIGVGGCGKTRLALQVANGLLGEFADGVWMVNLAPLSDPALVPQAVATALGIPEQPGRALKDTLADALRPRVLLLLLDNCEHVLSSCAQLADALLRDCPDLRILTTSREPLGIAGEIRWRVPPLSLPDLQHLPPKEGLTRYDAVRLFLERAVAADSTFAMTDSSARAVADICQQLDGIPLAIELAAPWVRVLTVEQIIARLCDRFQLQMSGSRMALPRHQTLRAAIDWSYDLLSEKERILLNRLSVFRGGCTLEAAEAVCSGSGMELPDILNSLTQLVDKSLVSVETHGGEARYRLLETIRQYGRDRLMESGEATDMQRRHRDWYLALAERGEPELRGPAQVAWLVRFETEHDNLRAALDWSKTDEGGAEAGLRLAGALHGFWHMRGYLNEGREWLEAALSTSQDAPASVRARALCGAGVLALRQGDLGAEILLQQSLALFQELSDKWAIAYSLHHLAHVMEKRGDYDQATALFEQSLALFKEVGNKWGVGWSLHCLGHAVLIQGDYSRATALLEESLPICREVGNTWTLAYVLDSLGTVAEKQGNYERAMTLLAEALARARQVGDKYHIPALQYELANVSLHRGDNERAVTLYREGLVLRREIGDKPGLAECLDGLAGVACAQGYHEQAARLFGASEVLRETLAFHRAPSDQDDHDRRVASVRSALGKKSCGAAWAKGRAMTLEQAIEYALAPVEAAALTPRGTEKGLLTPREQEVAELIAQGRTNRQIATTLVITERTADTHVQHILNKLGVNSRAQIAAWAVEHRLHHPR